jgi:hypothetical protein
MKRMAILWASVILISCVTVQGAQWPDLWAYYPINQDDFKDYSGHGHDGTPVDGARTQLDAARGWVATFGVTSTAGTTGRVLCGTDDPSAGGQLTVCAWVKWGGANSNWQGIAGKSNNYNDRRWILQLRNNSVGTIQWGGADRLNRAIESTGGLPIGQWTHIAGTWDGTTENLLVNGVVIQTGQLAFSDEGATAPITIGIGEYNVAAPQSNSFNGVIDEILLFSRGLPPDEVRLLMQGLTPELASDPQPPDLATGVARDVTLSWKSGKYAATHDVYYGTSASDVNNAGRSNPLGVLVSQGQGAAQFKPARLQLGQTYYWRVDEVNAAPSTTIFRGKLWSFTAEPVGYQMTNIKATASSTLAGSAPENTINGSGVDVSDLHSNDTAAMWVTAKGDTSPWIQYTFDRVYKLYEMWVWNYDGQFENMLGFGLKSVTIQYSVDGAAWTTLGDFEFARAPAASGYAHNTTVSFDGVSARYVKFSINSCWGTRGQYGLSEVRFFFIPVQALYPVPASGSVGLSPDISLSWQPGREVAQHQVFLGTDANAVAAATTPTTSVTQSSYTPADLGFGTTYYWKVNEVNTAASPTTWEGDVWSFSTQDYLVVDDMESYTDDEPDRVFDTWIDGWGTSVNGAQVGYGQAPFAERTAYHDGQQSMPFFYNNDTVKTYSEATRTFDTTQDWTRAGIKTLTLWFYGDMNNVPAQLYVKINGTEVVYNGDQGDLARRRWTQWNADLSALPASTLKAVKTLAIGVGNGTGSGKLLLDDIRLYQNAPALPVASNPGTTGLIAYYALNNNLQDSSGNGNNGTSFGTATYAAALGAFGTCLKLNGAGDCVDLGKKAVFNPTGSFSVSLWANIGDWSSDWVHVMIGNRGEPALGPGWAIRRYNSNSLCWTTRGTDATEDTASTIPMWLNEWIQIVCVFDSVAKTKAIYINGVQSGTAATTASQITPSTHNTYIGARANADNTAPEAFFNGMLDEIRLYNRALSAAEAEYLSDPTP